MWGCSINLWNRKHRKHTNLDTVVGYTGPRIRSNMSWRRVFCVCMQLLLFWFLACIIIIHQSHMTILRMQVHRTTATALHVCIFIFFWAGMRFVDFKLSCIASRRANISWAIRSSSWYKKGQAISNSSRYWSGSKTHRAGWTMMSSDLALYRKIWKWYLMNSRQYVYSSRILFLKSGQLFATWDPVPSTIHVHGHF